MLAIRLKSIVDWEKYTKANTTGATFIKFIVKNNKLDSLVFTGRPPAILIASFTQALQSTSSSWRETDAVFLLPVIYVFEMEGKKPKETTAANLVYLLKDVYEDKKQGPLPGQGNYTPLQCVVLNPYFVKAYW